jgi:hypothetical protein
MTRKLVVFPVVAILAFAHTALAQAPPADKVTLTLADGSKLVGQVVKQEADKVTIKLATLGEVTIPTSIVMEVNGQPTGVKPIETPPQAPAPAPSMGGAPLQAGPTAPPTFTPKATWLRMIKGGGSFTQAPFIQGPVQVEPALPVTVTGAQLKLPGDQFGGQLYGAIARYAAMDAFSLEASYSYAKVEPLGAQTNLTTSDFAYNRKVNETQYIMSRTSYRKDRVKNVDYSFQEMAGYGFKVVNTPQTKWDVIPGLLVAIEKKGTPLDNDILLGGGLFQNMVHFFNQQVMFEERALGRVVFNHTEAWALNAYAGFKGQINKHLGLTMGASYDYDNNLKNAGTVVKAGTIPGVPVDLTFFANEKGQFAANAGLQLQW